MGRTEKQGVERVESSEIMGPKLGKEGNEEWSKANAMIMVSRGTKDQSLKVAHW